MDLGRTEYAAAFRLQEELRQLREGGEIPDTFVALEHEPCVTIGRGGTSAHVLVDQDVLAAKGIAVHVSDRGGDVTYHGPGQLVCYAIVNLADYDRDLHAHVRRLEAVMMQTASAFGIVSWRRSGFPGVWTARGKLGALGVAVRRWVTTHGVALNVCPDMEPFSLIIPCGLAGVPVTSLSKILGRSPDLSARPSRPCAPRARRRLRVRWTKWLTRS